ncbi:hypothetical protein [Microbacterium sp. 77mftsu3.1]|uniref:hypothetical protein n=1 Tax=Microbacterium sp. 77mftsu3.1 TaxID=1761802 RepID=UPI00035EAEF9|nr:hypothetical protein [Microbacterium sp. 77mftsu3.1]SDG22759.1 hypothetical protein SAMN04488590_0248 [Microbacterium sp. 77mftsu3.1]
MTDFVASNGIPVHIHEEESGAIRLFTSMPDGTYPTQAAAGDDVQALREFFRAEEDERLGRWRWPYEGNRHIVVYPIQQNPDRVLVIDEAAGTASYRDRGEQDDRFKTAETEAAAAYFDAHPESKPWHDAKIGEVWILTIDGDESPVAFRPGLASHMDGRRADVDHATAGRRIWPEDAS